MGMFVAAYLAVWTAVALYVMWLGVRQRRMRRALEALQLHVEQSEVGKEQTSAAA